MEEKDGREGWHRRGQLGSAMSDPGLHMFPFPFSCLQPCLSTHLGLRLPSPSPGYAHHQVCCEAGLLGPANKPGRSGGGWVGWLKGEGGREGAKERENPRRPRPGSCRRHSRPRPRPAAPPPPGTEMQGSGGGRRRRWGSVGSCRGRTIPLPEGLPWAHPCPAGLAAAHTGSATCCLGLRCDNGDGPPHAPPHVPRRRRRRRAPQAPAAASLTCSAPAFRAARAEHSAPPGAAPPEQVLQLGMAGWRE